MSAPTDSGSSSSAGSLQRRRVGPYLLELLDAPAERLALFRGALGIFCFLYLAVRYGSFVGVSRFAARQFEPVGLVAWTRGAFPSLLEEPLTEPAVHVSMLLTIALSAAFAAGLAYRFVAPLFAVSLLWVTSYKSSFGMVFHTENLVTMHVLALAFAPAADRLAYKPLPKVDRGGQARGTRYGAPLLACAVIAVIAYLLAGIAKWRLAGVDWIQGDVLRVQVAYDNLRKIELGSIHSPLGAWAVSAAWLFPPLAIVTMLAEFGGPLALLHRRLAQAWVALIFGFHVGVLALMAIGFAYPLSGVAFFPLFPLERWRPARWLLQRFSPREQAVRESPIDTPSVKF